MHKMRWIKVIHLSKNRKGQKVPERDKKLKTSLGIELVIKKAAILCGVPQIGQRSPLRYRVYTNR